MLLMPFEPGFKAMLEASRNVVRLKSGISRHALLPRLPGPGAILLIVQAHLGSGLVGVGLGLSSFRCGLERHCWPNALLDSWQRQRCHRILHSKPLARMHAEDN